MVVHFTLHKSNKYFFLSREQVLENLESWRYEQSVEARLTRWQQDLL